LPNEIHKTGKEKNKITAAICFSLLIHFAVAALLVFGLSSNLISPPKLNGINLVWVSLDTKSKNNGVIIQKSRLEQPSLAVERATPKRQILKSRIPNRRLRKYLQQRQQQRN
jgi:hypothetical protein